MSKVKFSVSVTHEEDRQLALIAKSLGLKKTVFVRALISAKLKELLKKED